LKRLLQGSEPVLGLLGKNPFPENPPRYVRAVKYRFKFSPWSETNGRWWVKSEKRLYMPPLTLRNGELTRVRRPGGP
ncbi:MAG: lipase maturation factor family protein, partial [bacterium]